MVWYRGEYWSVEGSIGMVLGSIGYRGGIEGGVGVTGVERIAGEVICEVAEAKIQ